MDWTIKFTDLTAHFHFPPRALLQVELNFTLIGYIQHN